MLKWTAEEVTFRIDPYHGFGWIIRVKDFDRAAQIDKELLRRYGHLLSQCNINR